MRILLDTHIALWGIVGDKRLASGARDLIVDMRNEVFVSTASVWEISIKHGLSRGGLNDMPVSGEDALGFFRQSGYQLLAITADHAVATSSLPDIHRDPFDRIIVAQAIAEPLRLITHDRVLGDYSDTILVF